MHSDPFSITFANACRDGHFTHSNDQKEKQQSSKYQKSLEIITSNVGPEICVRSVT